MKTIENEYYSLRNSLLHQLASQFGIAGIASATSSCEYPVSFGFRDTHWYTLIVLKPYVTFKPIKTVLP